MTSCISPECRARAQISPNLGCLTDLTCTYPIRIVLYSFVIKRFCWKLHRSVPHLALSFWKRSSVGYLSPVPYPLCRKWEEVVTCLFC